MGTNQSEDDKVYVRHHAAHVDACVVQELVIVQVMPHVAWLPSLHTAVTRAVPRYAALRESARVNDTRDLAYKGRGNSPAHARKAYPR